VPHFGGYAATSCDTIGGRFPYLCE
jgi:hypothetical protein